MLLKCSLGAPRCVPGGCGLLPCALRRRLGASMACRGDIQPPFAEGRFFVCSGCADAVSCLTCLVRNWNAPATCASCTSSYLGSRAHLDGRDGPRRRPWQKVCLADVWLPAPFSRRRTRGSVALNGIEEEPALKLTQIVIRLPCARPSRQTHPRELPEDILGRRRATTHQRLPRWCGNAAQTS